ncbi:hypothetical protein [Cupriavidus sp. USMAA2-4]|uniref:outer membrane lipoprotein n=1 Tax=Cupriavidus sp. USMAA2-4 TaxID=876364 RepID=UPI0009FBE832|nr:hypothetical protein [Cupriavidus sp. USMAA2-4]
MSKFIAILFSAAAVLSGCAVEHTSPNYYRPNEALQRAQVELVSVVRVRPVVLEGSNDPAFGMTASVASVVATIAGATIGAQAGSGRGRYVAAAIAGPVAGLVTQQVMTRIAVPRRTGLEILVRTDYGQLVSVVQDADQAFLPGDRVLLRSGAGGTRVTR